MISAAYTRDPDLDFEAVVFADAESGGSLEIARSLSTPTSEETATGAHGYCVTVDGGSSMYGGVVSIDTDNDSITIHFTAEAESILGVGSPMTLVVHRGQLAMISSRLNEIVS